MTVYASGKLLAEIDPMTACGIQILPVGIAILGELRKRSSLLLEGFILVSRTEKEQRECFDWEILPVKGWATEVS